MIFPIKFDEEGLLEGYARGVRTARHSAEQEGKPYDGSIMGPWDRTLTLEPQDYEHARKWVEDERGELQENMDAYIAAQRVHIFCRNFVLSDRQQVSVEGGPGGLLQPLITIKDLFFQLGFPEERLRQVYEFGKLDEMHPGEGYEEHEHPIGFSGSFTENGKQRLADILKKEIIFYRQPTSEPHGEDPETYIPQAA